MLPIHADFFFRLSFLFLYCYNAVWFRHEQHFLGSDKDDVLA